MKTPIFKCNLMLVLVLGMGKLLVGVSGQPPTDEPDFSGFNALASYDGVTSVEVAPGCQEYFSGQRTRIAFSVKPTSDSQTTVSSTPANLVDTFVTNGVLKFAFNGISLALNTAGAGVLIEVPQADLSSVSVAGQETVQVLSGFTGLASASSLGQSTLHITADSLTDVSTAGQSDMDVAAKSVSVSAGGQSDLRINGNVSGGSAGGQAMLTVQGSIAQLTAGFQSSVRVNDSSGVGCQNVDTGFQADCETTTETVTVPQDPAVYTATVTHVCTASLVPAPVPTPVVTPQPTVAIPATPEPSRDSMPVPAGTEPPVTETPESTPTPTPTAESTSTSSAICFRRETEFGSWSVVVAASWMILI